MPESYAATTALIVVDMQNDFTDPAGSLYITGADDLVPVINTEIESATAAGAPVFYTQDWHPRETPHFADFGGLWPVHCVHDTWGAEMFPALTVTGELVHKGTGAEDGYSGFSGNDLASGNSARTALADHLTTAGVQALVVVGVAGDFCVKATALDARALGYPVRLPLSCTGFANLADGDDERAIAELRDAGVSVS